MRCAWPPDASCARGATMNTMVNATASNASAAAPNARVVCWSRADVGAVMGEVSVEFILRKRSSMRDYTDDMTSLQAIELRPRSVGELLGLSLKLLFGKFGVVMGITMIILLPVMLVQLLGTGLSLAQSAAASTLAPQVDSSMLALTIGSICAGVLSLALGLLFPWMEGALTHNAIERMLGRSPGVRDSYRAVRSAWPALFGSNLIRQIVLGLVSAFIGLLLGIGVLFATNVSNFGVDAGSTLATTIAVITAALCAPVGFVLVVLMGILAVNWSLRAPAIVGESVGAFGALSRSNELVRGNRWRMIGRLLPVAILDLVFAGLPSFLLSVMVSGEAFRQVGADAMGMLMPAAGALSVIGALVSILLVPFTIIYLTVNYLDLRVRKENLAAQLATAGQPVEPQAITVVQTHTHENDLYASAPTPAQRIIALTNRIRKEGESVALLTELSGAFREVGDLGSAADMLARARALAPQDATTALNLALVHRARKDMSAARAAFADYLQLETNTDDLARVRSNPQFQSLLPE